MRIQIIADGVPTEPLRALLGALAEERVEAATVTLDGPNLWRVQTPMMTPRQHARVMAKLVTFEGTPVADVLDEVTASRRAPDEAAAL